ncbi:uncharacterized protein O3C94_020140 [Discoglossus pictus]
MDLIVDSDKVTPSGLSESDQEEETNMRSPREIKEEEMPVRISEVSERVKLEFEQEETNMRSPRQIKEEEIPVSISEVSESVKLEFDQEETNMRSPRQIKEEETPVNISDVSEKVKLEFDQEEETNMRSPRQIKEEEMPVNISEVSERVKLEFDQEETNMRSPREIKEEEIPVSIREGLQDEHLYPELLNEEGECERDEKPIHQLEIHSGPGTSSERVKSEIDQEDETNVGSHQQIKEEKIPVNIRSITGYEALVLRHFQVTTLPRVTSCDHGIETESKLERCQCCKQRCCAQIACVRRCPPCLQVPTLSLPAKAQVQPAPLGAQVQPAPLGAQVQPAPLGAQVQPAPLGAQVQPAPLGAQVQPAPLGAQSILRLSAPSPTCSCKSSSPVCACKGSSPVCACKGSSPVCACKGSSPVCACKGSSQACASIMGSKDATTQYKKEKITIEHKKKIIAKHDGGSRICDLVAEFKMPRSTISTIVRNKEAVKSADVSTITKQRSKTLEKVDKLLYVWINEKQRTGKLISQAMICDKAKQLHADVVKDNPAASGKSSEEFKASRGWFKRFVKRTGIEDWERHRVLTKKQVKPLSGSSDSM